MQYPTWPALQEHTLHEQLGPKQDINKSEDHEGPFSSKAMIALRSEIKMSLIASCLYIFKYWSVKKVFAFFKFVGIE